MINYRPPGTKVEVVGGLQNAKNMQVAEPTSAEMIGSGEPITFISYEIEGRAIRTWIATKHLRDLDP